MFCFLHRFIRYKSNTTRTDLTAQSTETDRDRGIHVAIASHRFNHSCCMCCKCNKVSDILTAKIGVNASFG